MSIEIPVIVTIASVLVAAAFGRGGEEPGVIPPAPPPAPSPDPATTLPGATPLPPTAPAPTTLPGGTPLPDLPTSVPATPTDLAIAHRQIMTFLQTRSTDPRYPTNLPLLDPDLMIAIGTRLRDAGFAAEGTELVTWADCVRLARDDAATVEARRAAGYSDELSYFAPSCGPYRYAPAAPSENEIAFIKAYQDFVTQPLAIANVGASDDLERRLRAAGFEAQANDLRRRRSDLGNLLFMNASGPLSGSFVQAVDIQRAIDLVRVFDTHGYPELSSQLRQAITRARGSVATQHGWRCRATGGCAVHSRPSQTTTEQTILAAGEVVEVVGRTTDGNWLEIRMSRAPFTGFALASAFEEVKPSLVSGVPYARFGARAPARLPGWHLVYHRDPFGHLRPAWAYG